MHEYVASLQLFEADDTLVVLLRRLPSQLAPAELPRPPVGAEHLSLNIAENHRA